MSQANKHLVLCPFTAAVRQQAVATYVEMKLPTPPVPKPRTRINGEYNDYANVVPIEEGSCVAAVDNNNNSNGNGTKLRLVRHSPTPDYPPPTVTEAERTIFNFMQPATLRKNSLLEPAESPRTTNSVSSDQVEEYVADIPFAGLFKGSTLNLSSDVVDGIGAVPGDREFLQSPSMVRSAHVQNHRRSLSKQRYSALGEDFSASRVWAEIDTIFENIGNEVSTVEQEVEEFVEDPSSLSLEDSRQSLHIRDPAELLLGRNRAQPPPIGATRHTHLSMAKFDTLCL